MQADRKMAAAPDSSWIEGISEYAADVCRRDLPDEVVEKAVHHILDTLCAMITGAQLDVGRMALSFATQLGTGNAASVTGAAILRTAPDAAMMNGLIAHADETDDSHPGAIGHPGCAVVPAALAAAEANGRSGRDFLRAVVLGYDYYARMNMALGPQAIYARGHGPYSIGGTFGAAAAAGALFGIDADRMRFVFSNAAQQAGGIATWMRCVDRMEKAFHFGGLPARNGVLAAAMIAHGFNGTRDALTGRGNFMDAYSDNPDRDVLTNELGTRFEILRTNIKKWCVGSPIQSALDSLEWLMENEGVSLDNFDSAEIHLPTHVVDVVEDRGLPDINCRHCLALMLVDGRFGFHAIHDDARMNDPQILAVKSRLQLVASDELAAATPIRQAIVSVRMTDGRTVSRRTQAVKGVFENPMIFADVEAKARDLLSPLLTSHTDAFIALVRDIDQMPDVRALRPYLQAAG